MPLRFFDVVVLGMRPGALACAALLARRDFRVLVIGDAHLPSTYRYAGVPLRRRAFTHLAANSPTWRRVLAELAQSQVFRRRLRPLDPMFQVLGRTDTRDATFRLDVPPDTALFAKELDRELPSARPPIEQLYDGLAKIDAQIDSVLEQDAVWPPGTFWERRETRRLAAMLPLVSTPFPVDPAYRQIIEIGARFASHLAGPLPAIATARLHGAWTRGPFELPGDEDALTDSLVERIRAHGGDVRPRERCEAILHQRGKVRGVMLESDGEETGCAFVIGDKNAARLLDRVRDLPDGYGAAQAAVASRRFVVSLVVRRSLVPPPLARHCFLRPTRTSGVDVRLQRASFTAPDSALAEHDAELWVCEALFDEMPHDLSGREAVLATVRDHFPCVDHAALVIDSPHDGAPLFTRILDGRVRDELSAVTRADLRPHGGSVHAEPGEPLYHPTADAFAELAVEPIRTPLHNMLTVGPTVVPALGIEGELLAAWGAARLITRTDRKRERMRRELWSKIEI